MAFRPDPSEPDFEQLRAVLAQAQLQKENNPLFQLLSQLITKISNLKTGTNIKIDADKLRINQLLLQLNQIDKDKTDGPASSTDNAIARWDGTTGKILQDSIVLISDLGLISGAINEFLTASDESTNFPNSRQLLAGVNVTFDDTVANERTINVTASSADYVVLSDGVVAGPTPVNDGAGNFIYVAYTP